MMVRGNGDPGGSQLSRRRFLQSTAGFAAVAAGLTTCSGSETTSGAAAAVETEAVDRPTVGLQQRLDMLLTAYEDLGLHVAPGLRPPATEAQIDEVSDELGFAVPADVRQLWTWHNGWVDAANVDPLWFRDNWLTGTVEVDEHRETMGYYDYPDVGVDISKCVPIAGFDGSVYAVATGFQSLLPGHPRPVIQFFEGVDAYFHSVATMVETAIAWVTAPGYRSEDATLDDEFEIWKRLNPDLSFW